MYKNFRITKREVLASISIIAVMLVIGVLISGWLAEVQADQNEKYNKAIKIRSADIFEYSMRTNVGNAFVYGDLEAVDIVTYPEIGGAYMYVEKIKEHYTRHTRQVAHTRTVNGKTETYYTTETYWTWDRVDHEDIRCEQLSFCGVVFSSSKIDIPESSYIETIKESSHVRYKYYGTDVNFTGTIFAELKDETISDYTPFYMNMTIEETVEHLESGSGIILFWIFWVILICFCVYGFYYFENKWLE
jgi:PKD repeat protein